MKRFWKWIGIAAFVGIVMLELGPQISGPSFSATRVRNLSNAKQLGLAAKLFAEDHDGLFPMHLTELAPEVIPAGNLDDLLCATEIDDESQPRLKYDWLYFGAGFDDKNPPPLLIASPLVFKDGAKQKRVIIRGDLSGPIVNENEYQAELRKTIEAMHQRFDAAKPAP